MLSIAEWTDRALALSSPMKLTSSASFSPSIRISLRLKIHQAQAKNFCRVLDIRVTEIMQRQIVWYHLGLIFCNIRVVDLNHPFKLRSGAANMHLRAIIPDKDEIVLKLFAAGSFPVVTQSETSLLLFMHKFFCSGDDNIRYDTLSRGMGLCILMNDFSFYDRRRFGEVDCV